MMNVPKNKTRFIFIHYLLGPSWKNSVQGKAWITASATTNPQMTRGPPVRHEQPWKTSLPLSLAVEQSHRDDLTRSRLCKLLQEVKALWAKEVPHPVHILGPSRSAYCKSYFGSKCSDKSMTKQHESVLIKQRCRRSLGLSEVNVSNIRTYWPLWCIQFWGSLCFSTSGHIL